jgi:hypothetical protein
VTTTPHPRPPGKWHNITIAGNTRTAAQKLAETNRFVLRDWVATYRAAGLVLPPHIVKACEEHGVAT